MSDPSATMVAPPSTAAQEKAGSPSHRVVAVECGATVASQVQRRFAEIVKVMPVRVVTTPLTSPSFTNFPLKRCPE